MRTRELEERVVDHTSVVADLRRVSTFTPHRGVADLDKVNVAEMEDASNDLKHLPLVLVGETNLAHGFLCAVGATRANRSGKPA